VWQPPPRDDRELHAWERLDSIFVDDLARDLLKKDGTLGKDPNYGKWFEGKQQSSSDQGVVFAGRSQHRDWAKQLASWGLTPREIQRHFTIGAIDSQQLGARRKAKPKPQIREVEPELRNGDVYRKFVYENEQADPEPRPRADDHPSIATIRNWTRPERHQSRELQKAVLAHPVAASAENLRAIACAPVAATVGSSPSKPEFPPAREAA